MLTTYEGILLFRSLPKDELATCVKRVAGFIYDKGGILRQLLYMGHRRVPIRQSKNKTPFWEAHYLYYEFNAPTMKMQTLTNEFQRDNDIIRHTICPRKVDMDPKRIKASTPFPKIDFDACTFEEEMAPVPYRPKVMEIVELGKRIRKNKTRKIIKMNSNIDYDPFETC